MKKTRQPKSLEVETFIVDSRAEKVPVLSLLQNLLLPPLPLHPSLTPEPATPPSARTSLHLPCTEPRPLALLPAPFCYRARPCFLHLLYTESASISSSALRQPSSAPDPLSSAPPTAGNDVPLHASITGNHTPSALSLRAIMHSGTPCFAPLPPAPSLHPCCCTTLLRLLHSAPNHVPLLPARYSHAKKIANTGQISIIGD
ncbi:hypothetical protein SLEP1_g40977 [Rubroshorea leprosula]|uniref:Uncharacterized protein n=1 Tax=Rubroshorea leprosula TaxID=152421 RepID=A0AAV5L555_9ROSI|nr:hypothetical protein SLEP1_g40977 [Rubroshorea leprosula]